MSEPIIQLKKVNKSFGDNRVLKEVDLDIYPNQITVILGKSGVGKSVLLKHMVGLLKPDSGEVFIEGRELWHMNRSQRKAMLDKISYLFQGTALFDSMNVFDNISLPLTERTRLKPAEIAERVRRVCEILDLEDIDGKYPSQLSGGMQKRVALARALVTKPEILLFDEPTTGLDPVRVVSVLKMIHEYHTKLGFTGVLVSHAIPEILYVTQRVAFIHEGSIIFQGTVQELVTSTNPNVREFFATRDTACMNLNLDGSSVESWQVDKDWSGTRTG